MLRRIPTSIVLVVSLSSVVALAESRPQLTPFLGYRFGGGVESLSDGVDFDIDPSASFGLIFDKPLKKNRQTTFEVVWSHQGTDVDLGGSGDLSLDIDYLHFGATYCPSDAFVVMSAGLTRFDPSGFSSETKFSMAAGGGVRKMFSERIGLRIEGRAYLTFAGSSTEIFCSDGGGGASCLFSFSGDAVVQAEINVGLIVAF